jgi:uncharacterized protein YkwD
MKHIIFIILSIYTKFGFAQTVTIQDDIYREGEMNDFLNGIENDKFLQLERMTSMAFHNILNEYRASEGGKTIYWDDKLWMAARNHTVYMHRTADFSHTESWQSEIFTGLDPENRVDFVTYDINEFDNASYENIAVFGQNFSEAAAVDMSFANDLTWEEMLELAVNNAQSMFEMWKDSPGHNQNMLEEDHLAHGTSIIYNENTESAYATSVFAQYQEYYNPITFSLDFYTGWENDFKPNFKEDYPEVNPMDGAKKVMHRKLFSNLLNYMSEKNIYEDDKLKELIVEAPDEENDSELKKRYLKSTKYLGVFKLINHEIKQYKFKTTVDLGDNFLNDCINWQHEVLSTCQDFDRASGFAGIIEFIDNKSEKSEITLKVYTIGRKR